MRHLFLAAVDGQGVHGEIVGADGEEIRRAGERVGRERGARHLDHDAQRRQRIGDLHASAGQAPGDLDQLLAHGRDL